MRWLIVFLAACEPGSGFVEDSSTGDTDGPDGPPIDTLEQFQAAFVARFVDLCESYEPACYDTQHESCQVHADHDIFWISAPYCRYSEEAARACLEADWPCVDSDDVGLSPPEPPCDSVSICGVEF